VLEGSDVVLALFRQPAVTGELHTLEHGPFTLVVAPSFGGRIVSFRKAGRDILRAATAEAISATRAYDFAGFPLMPYSGPLFGPGFSFQGHDYALDRTVREEPTATHGDAWVGSFQVQDKNASRLQLQYEHEPAPGTFPFRWRGRLGFGLSNEGLRISLAVTSRDHRLMPAGIGYHPYFPKPPGTRLRFDSVAMWPADAPEAVGQGCGPLVPGLDFTAGADVSEIVVDRLYDGWDQQAELTYPDGFRTRITADGALDKLQLYSAWHYPYVCVEPVSNANDGFNRMARGVASHGVRVLEPGASIAGSMVIDGGPA